MALVALTLLRVVRRVVAAPAAGRVAEVAGTEERPGEDASFNTSRVGSITAVVSLVNLPSLPKYSSEERRCWGALSWRRREARDGRGDSEDRRVCGERLEDSPWCREVSDSIVPRASNLS